MMVPNIVGRKQAIEQREAYVSALRLMQKARFDAIDTGKNIEVAYDDSSSTLRLTQITPAQNNQSEEREDSTSFSFPSEISATNFRLAGSDVNSGDWQLMFYPDGKSNGGGFEIVRGNDTRSISITTDGFATLSNSGLATATSETWDAGTYVQRQ